MEDIHSHILKIILVDDNHKLIEDNKILNKIKKTLCKGNTHTMLRNGETIDVTIKWHKQELSESKLALRGDLFIASNYIDNIILQHIQKTLSMIKCKYTIDFYVSKIIMFDLI